MTDLALMARNMSRCMQKDRFEIFETEKYLHYRSEELVKSNELLAGLHGWKFDIDSDFWFVAVSFEATNFSPKRSRRQATTINGTIDESVLPKRVDYTIRMDVDHTPQTNQLKQTYCSK